MTNRDMQAALAVVGRRNSIHCNGTMKNFQREQKETGTNTCKMKIRGKITETNTHYFPSIILCYFLVIKVQITKKQEVFFVAVF